jgi:hypothetical protein
MTAKKNTPQYVIVTIKPWNSVTLKKYFAMSENFYLITIERGTALQKLRTINLRHIFFPYWWSWIDTKEILWEYDGSSKDRSFYAD